jgi:hypothetical protein
MRKEKKSANEMAQKKYIVCIHSRDVRKGRKV